MNGIVSTDSRAWEYPERWEKDGTADKAFKKTYQKILACQPVSLLCWLRDNRPEVYNNIEWIFECKDYIRFRLTGEAYAELVCVAAPIRRSGNAIGAVSVTGPVGRMHWGVVAEAVRTTAAAIWNANLSVRGAATHCR